MKLKTVFAIGLIPLTSSLDATIKKIGTDEEPGYYDDQTEIKAYRSKGGYWGSRADYPVGNDCGYKTYVDLFDFEAKSYFEQFEHAYNEQQKK